MKTFRKLIFVFLFLTGIFLIDSAPVLAAAKDNPQSKTAISLSGWGDQAEPIESSSAHLSNSSLRQTLYPKTSDEKRPFITIIGLIISVSSVLLLILKRRKRQDV